MEWSMIMHTILAQIEKCFMVCFGLTEAEAGNLFRIFLVTYLKQEMRLCHM